MDDIIKKKNFKKISLQSYLYKYDIFILKEEVFTAKP